MSSPQSSSSQNFQPQRSAGCQPAFLCPSIHPANKGTYRFRTAGVPAGSYDYKSRQGQISRADSSPRKTSRSFHCRSSPQSQLLRITIPQNTCGDVGATGPPSRSSRLSDAAPATPPPAAETPQAACRAQHHSTQRAPNFRRQKPPAKTQPYPASPPAYCPPRRAESEKFPAPTQQPNNPHAAKAPETKPHPLQRRNRGTPSTCEVSSAVRPPNIRTRTTAGALPFQTSRTSNEVIVQISPFTLLTMLPWQCARTISGAAEESCSSDTLANVVGLTLVAPASRSKSTIEKCRTISNFPEAIRLGPQQNPPSIRPPPQVINFPSFITAPPQALSPPPDHYLAW